MNTPSLTPEDRVLILGGSGFVGKRLVIELAQKNIKLRLLVRDRAKAAPLIVKGADLEVVQGDLLGPLGLEAALRDIHTAYYLVHSMGGKTLFKNEMYAEKDRIAAKNFIAAADAAGLKRIIYLGGLGETNDNLSEGAPCGSSHPRLGDFRRRIIAAHYRDTMPRQQAVQVMSVASARRPTREREHRKKARRCSNSHAAQAFFRSFRSQREHRRVQQEITWTGSWEREVPVRSPA